MLAAREPGSARVHEHWGDNVFLETLVDVGIESALDAPIKVSRTISTGRQCMAPIEGRGTVVSLDHRLDQIVVHTASQMPHIVRNGLSECLGIEQGRIRIVSPDVGGGFGYKAILLAEDVALAWLALRCGHPVRGDRRFRRLFGLPVLGLPGGRAGRQHPAGSLRFPGLSLPDMVGGHQQVPDPALPGRRAHRRLLRPGTGARRRRPRGRDRARDCAREEPRAARADAVREHHQEAFRQRRLPGGAGPGAEGRRRGGGPRPPASGRAGSRPPTAPRSIPAGASRWCPATNRPAPA